MRDNTPFDEFVRKLIASEGAYYEPGNEAIGFYLRDRGMPLDNLANTVQVFLGTRLECAMCHDHPFDKWTQKQFYEMSAFTDGVSRVRGPQAFQKVVGDFNKLAQKDGTADTGALNQYRNYLRDILGYGLDDNLGKGTIKLTDAFMEDDAKPGDVLQAKAIFAPPLEIKQGTELPKSREQFSTWITSEANPRFTTVIVNRLWKRAFGIGLIEPLDDMNDNTESSNPKLLAYLEKIMASVDYDVKEFMRVLYSMDLFTRESVKDDHKGVETYYFAGPPLQRMTGEQIWDSLVTLAYPDVDNRKFQKPSRNYDNFLKYSSMTGDELFAEVMRRTGIDPNAQAAARPANGMPKIELNQKQKGSIEVVMKYADLYCMNCHDSGKSRGDVNIEQFHDDPAKLAGDPIMLKMFASALEKKEMPPPNRQLQPTIQERREIVTALNTLLAEAPAAGATMPNETMAKKLGDPINTDCPIKPGRAIDPTLLALNEDGETVGFCCESCLNQFKRNMTAQASSPKPSSTSSASTANYVKDRNSVRASEVGSPAPNGHLIREFGGSDREQIENSHKQASVTQVLNMLNGYVEQRIIGKKDALVMNNVKNAGSQDSQIDAAFLSILNRKPTSKEKSLLKSSLKVSGDNFYKDVVWVLVNSHEFLFIQ
ncbi:MAG: hypothetical protein CMI24_09070 [Opitutae bacterium]|nr:hypothetical protein [Opitutae bacterium]